MDWQGGNTGWGSNTFPFSYGTQGTNGTPLRQDHYTELPAYLEYNEEVEEEEDDELYFQQQEQAAAQGLTHSPGFVYAFHPTVSMTLHTSTPRVSSNLCCYSSISSSEFSKDWTDSPSSISNCCPKILECPCVCVRITAMYKDVCLSRLLPSNPPDFEQHNVPFLFPATLLFVYSHRR